MREVVSIIIGLLSDFGNEFDSKITQTIEKMIEKESDEAVISAKLKVTFERRTVIYPNGEAVPVIKPTFEFGVSSSLSLKTKSKGSLSEVGFIEFDPESGSYTIDGGDDQMKLPS